MQVDDERSSGVEWSHPEEGWLQRIGWRFVVTSWLLAFVLAAVVSALVGGAAILVQGTVDTNDAEIVMILGVLITFWSFFGVLNVRLRGLDHDRFLNALTVGALHTVVSGALLLTALVLRATIDGNLLPGNRFDELGLIFVTLERTAAISIPACALAAAIMPAIGAVPHGTQTEPVETDRQL